MVSLAPAPAEPAAPLPPRRATVRTRMIRAVAIVLFLALLAFCWEDVQGSFGALVKGLFAGNGLLFHFVPSGVPPALSQFWPGIKAAVVTLSIAVLSIVFGVIFAVAVLPFAARNLTPSRTVYELVRFVLAVLRAIPELIMLLMFNVVLGFSPFSSVVALVFHGIGVQGKLYAEAVEEMDMTPADALRVAGASRTQVFLHAVVPGISPTLLGLTLYRLDANFRSAVTLGAVGGGGIGFLIDNQLNVFQFKDVTTYLIIMVVAVMGIERISTVLRGRLTGDARQSLALAKAQSLRQDGAAGLLNPSGL
jgi:phosphonate transport system permease protein